jgi:hypothetical protein
MNQYEKPFIGAWSLREYKITNVDSGKEFYPFGDDAQGHIIYTPEGIMSATLMNPNRIQHSTDRATRMAFKEKIKMHGLDQLTSEENLIVLTYLDASYGFVGYCGSFDADSEQVHHRVKQSFYPNFVGTTATRDYRFKGDELHLSAEAAGLRDQLTWQRVSHA